MNDNITRIIGTLATAFIIWLSYTVYETSINVALLEQKIDSLTIAIQSNSER